MNIIDISRFIAVLTVWKPISIAPQYEISESGIVRRRISGKGSQSGKIIKQFFHSYGYPKVGLTINGKKHTVETHTLIATAFLGERPFPAAEVAHKDGNPLNCHYSNLRWSSHRANEKDKVLHGTHPAGERNGVSKLTADDVLMIRFIGRDQGLSVTARQFGISFQSVSKILNGQRWAHI